MLLRSTTLPLIACAALLSGTAGCTLEKADRASSMVQPAAATIVEMPRGHQMHLMFQAEKHNAMVAELPAQF